MTYHLGNQSIMLESMKQAQSIPIDLIIKKNQMPRHDLAVPNILIPPEKLTLSLMLAECRYRDNEIDAALHIYEHIIAMSKKDGTNDPSNAIILGRALLGLGSIEAEYGNIHEAIKCFRQSYQLLRSANNPHLTQVARFNLALVLDQAGKTRQSLEMLLELDKEALKENNKILRVMILTSLGSMEIRRGNVQSGWKRLLKAKNLAILSGNIHFILLVLNNLVDVSITLKKYHLAEYFAYYLQLFGMHVHMKNSSMLLVLSRLHRSMGNIFLAREYLEKAQEVLQDSPKNREWIWFYLETAQCILEDHSNPDVSLKIRRSQAYLYLQFARDLANEWGSWKDLSIVLLELARIQLEDMKLEQALSSIQQVLTLSRNSGFILLQLNALLVEASILALLDAFEQARENIEQARAIARRHGIDSFSMDIEQIEELLAQEELSHRLYDNCLEISEVEASPETVEAVQDYIQQAKAVMLCYQGT